MTYIVQQIRSTEEGRRPLASQLAEGQFALNVNDASPGIFLKTTEDKVVKVGGVFVGSEEPLVIQNKEYSTGELWYDTSVGELKIYDGLEWKVSSSSVTSTSGATIASRLSVLESSSLTSAGLQALLAEKADVTALASKVDVSLLSSYYTKAEIDAAGYSTGGSGSSFTNSDVDTHLNTSTATDTQILSWNASSGDYAWIAQPSGGGGGITAETDTLATVTARGAVTTNDITVGKIYFSNVFSTLSDLPSATTYHGMFAHVHSTGHGYFAHGGNWIKLGNHDDITSATSRITTLETGATSLDSRLDALELDPSPPGAVFTETDANVDDLITLSGVAENTTDLGTFTGSIITDNGDIKGALQELETATELKASLADPTFTGEVESSGAIVLKGNSPVTFRDNVSSAGSDFDIYVDQGSHNLIVTGIASGSDVDFRLNNGTAVASVTDTGLVLPTGMTVTIEGTAVTATGAELNYVDGVTSSIQTQLDAKASLDGTDLPGPYANDSAAATGGVAVGALYKKNGGQVNWRVS